MGRVDAAAVAASGALLAAGAIPQIISGPLGPYLRLDLGISSSELGLGLSLSAVPGVSRDPRTALQGDRLRALVR